MKTTIASLFASFITMVSYAQDGEAAKALKVGDPAPAMVTKSVKGEAIDLAATYKKGTTVVFFFPDTAGAGSIQQCTTLRDANRTLKENGFNLVGVSKESAANLKSFSDKFQLNFPIIQDGDGKVSGAFGVPERKPGKLARYSYTVFGGKIAAIERDVKPGRHAKSLTEGLAKLDGGLEKLDGVDDATDKVDKGVDKALEGLGGLLGD